jgi:hypothetical protein
VGDRGAGAIKSGGTCLSAHQRVYTNLGPVTVKELADSGKEFITLSFDPLSNRYKAKKAIVWFAGQKRTVTLRTDKGEFNISCDHPFRLPEAQQPQHPANAGANSCGSPPTLSSPIGAIGACGQRSGPHVETRMSLVASLWGTEIIEDFSRVPLTAFSTSA